MSGSRLGRGRGGRLAVYGACGVVVVLLVFLYRAATTEMSRLRELHVQCSHQHDALEAQLQVIYEYKMRLEKSLAEEKSSNTAVKQELQQRASRERSLRDKDSVEATQRFNSLQQNHKQLQAEHQDLKEECEKQQKQALEETKRLESTLRDLRTQLREAAEDKTKSMEHLKTVHLELKAEKDKLEEKYNALLKSNGNTDSTIEHLRKEVMQLNRELKDSQSSCKATSPGPSAISQRSQQQQQQLAQPNAASEGANQAAAAAVAADEQQGNRPSPQQQTSSNEPTSPRKLIPAAKAETSTKSGVNSASTVSNKSANPVAAAKPVKVKLPSGVLPILNVEANAKPEESGKDDADKNTAVKASNDEGKDHAKVQPGNGIAQAAAQGAAGRRHVGEQILHRQDEDWLRAKGIQEIGDDLGNMDKLPDFENAHLREGGEGADYENMGYDYKGPQQKNNGESEDEGEGEEDDNADYNDMKKEE